MDTTEPYHYSKTRNKLPNFQSFACKKNDVDTLLGESDSGAPFERLSFSKYGGLKKGKSNVRILLAFGSLRSGVPSLTIYSVPRELAGTIRLLMKQRGLPEILARFRAWSLKSETWRLAEHTFALWFQPKASQIAFEDEYLN